MLSSRKVAAATAAILLFIPALAQARPSNWHTTDGFVSATVDPRANVITIYMNVDGDKLLYWKGSFSSTGSIIVSKADREALRFAIFASENKYKTFVRRNNKLRFTMTFMGVTKRITLVRK